MSPWTVATVVCVLLLIACFVGIIAISAQEVRRLTALLHIQAAENASLRKRLAHAWEFANAPEEADAPPQAPV